MVAALHCGHRGQAGVLGRNGAYGGVGETNYWGFSYDMKALLGRGGRKAAAGSVPACCCGQRRGCFLGAVPRLKSEDGGGEAGAAARHGMSVCPAAWGCAWAAREL